MVLMVPFEKAISEQLCKITDELRKIRILNETQEAQDKGVVYIAIPEQGGTRSFPIGTTTIDFLNGNIKNPDGSVDHLQVTLQRLSKDFLHSLSLTSDKDIVIQIGTNANKQTVQATLGLELPYLTYNTLTITTTAISNISIFASTNPFSTVNGNTVSIMKGQYNGEPVTIAVDSSGQILAVMQGQSAGIPKIIATDADGKIQAQLYGMYGGNPTAVQVDSGGKLVIMNLSQSNIEGDLTEATTWDSPVANLQNNMNRIRNQIISITGEAWGTVSHTIAAIWAKFNATTGHKHTGAADDAPNIAWSSVTKTGSNISDLVTKSHTSLSDIGTNTHATIDTHIAASAAHGSSGNVVGQTTLNSHTSATSSVHNFDASGNAPAQTHNNTRHSQTYGIIGNGNYTGNQTQNRSVAHGLGTTPRLVLIVVDATNSFYGIIITGVGAIFFKGAGVDDKRTVTAPDATNFYVGDNVDWNRSLNATGSTYRWTAYA